MFGSQTGLPLHCLIFHLQMPHSPLKLPTPNSSLNWLPELPSWQRFGYVLEYRHFPLIKVQLSHDTSIPRNCSPSFASVTSIPRLNSVGALHIGVEADETSYMGECCCSMVGVSSSAEHFSSKEAVTINGDDSAESIGNEDPKERQRRVKIGLANKGKVPWNKGRKHSAETRERIKQRTREALKNPQVREKMAQRPRYHSNQIKKKIGSSLRHLWAKRLKRKSLREKLFVSWAESIAEAAKTGGLDQELLNWDSYDKIKEELVLQQLHQAGEKLKVKEMAKIRRAEKVAQTIAAKMEKLAHKKKMREEKIKAKEEKAKAKRIANRDRKESIQRLKLKQKLTKILPKITAPVTTRSDTLISHTPAWEKLDLELLKREKLQREVSLADQIRAAKDKRADFTATEAMTGSSPVHPSSENTRVFSLIRAAKDRRTDFTATEVTTGSSYVYPFSENTREVSMNL
ncbi:hypothetical protein UlMin_027587 [Ulmus minor]